jgi:hypothetical protein
MTDAQAIPRLAALRSFGRLGARLGVRAPMATACAETQGLVRALLALPPAVTWDGRVLEGALLAEVGERAAHALARTRRRVRRKERHERNRGGLRGRHLQRA